MMLNAQSGRGETGAGLGALGRQPGREGAALARAVEGDARHGAGVGRGEARRRAGIDEQQLLRARVGEHAGQALRRLARRQRRDDDAGAQRAEKDRGVLDRGAGADRDRLLRPDAVSLQRRQRCDPSARRARRSRRRVASGVDQGRMARIALGMQADHVGDQAELLVEGRRGWRSAHNWPSGMNGPTRRSIVRCHQLVSGSSVKIWSP